MADKTTNLGVVMDPIAAIKPYKDSTFAMLLAAQARGWRLHYMELGDIWLHDGVAHGSMRPLKVADGRDDFYELGQAKRQPLAELDAILMRKDPPFDMEYVLSTYVLQRAQEAGTLVVNAPRALREVNEKAYVAWFADLCPATVITRSKSVIREFLAEHQKIVVKPMDGMGGKSIFVVSAGDPNANVILETITADGRRFATAQAFVPEIVESGDTRILLIAGEAVPYGLARIPPGDDHRGNLAVGGTAEGRELDDNDLGICAAVGPVLRDLGVSFAGIDVIGGKLTEINVTSPTGIRELDQLFSLDIAGMLMENIAAQLAVAAA